jgi:AraC family transcriptional regulator, arabinose operon regulatory protein
MKINKIGINYTHNHTFSIERPQGSGDYLFLLIKTPAVFQLGGQDIIADKNSVIIYSKGTPQRYYARGNNFSNDFIHFDPEGDREFKSLPMDTLMVLPTTKQVSKITKEIYLEYISTNSCRNESMDMLLKLLFVKIKELAVFQYRDKLLYGYYEALVDLRSEVYRHPEVKWTVARLSQLVNLSPSHFQRLYKQAFGITCIADVIACKLEYAKASLLDTGGTVREISVQCGYENEEHFMRQFKQIVGVTPSDYRRMYGG